MEDTEKPKVGLFSKALPTPWFSKLKRSIRRKSRQSSLEVAIVDTSPPVNDGADSAPFLLKVVENVYKNRESFFTRLRSPGSSSSAIDEQQFLCCTPTSPGDDLYAPERNGFTLQGVTRNTSIPGGNTTTSIFSRNAYRSALASLKNLCNVAGVKTIANEGNSELVSFRKNDMHTTLRAWFLVGCGSASRRNRRRTQHVSMDLGNDAKMIELDVLTGLEAGEDRIREVEANSWRARKFESWSGDNPDTWSVELTDGEVVKWLVDDPKISSSDYLKPQTLGNRFVDVSESDDAPMMTLQETDDDLFEDPTPAPPWSSSFSSFGSSSESGGLIIDRKSWITPEIESALIPYSGDFTDNGNISDSQSLLRAKVLAAEVSREQRQLEKKREEETKKVLASLDKALDQYNLKRLTEEEDIRYNSPQVELHNSPVFESFLESSTKVWGIDFCTLKIEDSRASDFLDDHSKDLHCITAHIAKEAKQARDEQQNEIESTRRAIQFDCNSSMSPTRARKGKRSVEKETSKKRSPARNSEERTNHPQREDINMFDPPQMRHDEVVGNRKKKFNETRRRSKQRKLKQAASAPDYKHCPSSPEASISGAPRQSPKQSQGVVKDSVAVVVESSYDPYNDFRESMIEMIVDQDIHETSDLEELLQCYLALNESEYHEVIVDVFMDVWHELFESNT